MGMILRIASSRIVGQGDIVGRSGYFSLNLSANSVMRGRLDARRTLKSLVADLRSFICCIQTNIYILWLFFRCWESLVMILLFISSCAVWILFLFLSFFHDL